MHRNRAVHKHTKVSEIGSLSGSDKTRVGSYIHDDLRAVYTRFAISTTAVAQSISAHGVRGAENVETHLFQVSLRLI